MLTSLPNKNQYAWLGSITLPCRKRLPSTSFSILFQVSPDKPTGIPFQRFTTYGACWAASVLPEGPKCVFDLQPTHHLLSNNLRVKASEISIEIQTAMVIFGEPFMIQVSQLAALSCRPGSHPNSWDQPGNSW